MKNDGSDQFKKDKHSDYQRTLSEELKRNDSQFQQFKYHIMSRFLNKR